MSTYAPLTLQPCVIGGQTAEGDYSVMQEGRIIGRIRLTESHVRKETIWSWGITIPHPVPPWAAGGSSSLPAAKDAFRAAWDRLSAGMSEKDALDWKRAQDARSRP
jgi:hypothetical protein